MSAPTPPAASTPVPEGVDLAAAAAQEQMEPYVEQVEEIGKKHQGLAVTAVDHDTMTVTVRWKGQAPPELTDLASADHDVVTVKVLPAKYSQAEINVAAAAALDALGDAAYSAGGNSDSSGGFSRGTPSGNNPNAGNGGVGRGGGGNTGEFGGRGGPNDPNRRQDPMNRPRDILAPHFPDHILTNQQVLYRLAEGTAASERVALLWTFGVGVNVDSGSADVGTGPAFSYRGLMLTPMWHWGRDIRLTNGIKVNGELGSSPPTLTTERYWVRKFALGVSYRVPFN
jgi:hypothetical protein